MVFYIQEIKKFVWYYSLALWAVQINSALMYWNNNLSTSSLISPSFQGDPTIFHKGIFLKQTPHIKN